ncbi:cytochrome P450 [Phanerochaete sordida]|uniref:Cytochrome P450 n=1 Tax=Phanerochaete sordida TaxID=48140 RepID=A0A9P3GAC4_9APHY|nr:cytochrome P450 [Phanerochaete sordida]
MPKGFAALSQEYGPFCYMRVINQDFVFVNDLDLAREIFENRGAIYSHRPRMVMMQEVIKRDTLLFMNYGSDFARIRKLVATFLNSREAAKYWPAQEVESLKFVLAVQQAPQDALQLTRWTSTSLIIRLLYGIEVRDKDDVLVCLAEDFARITFEATSVGGWLVNYIPILRHFPSWLPGAGFKRWAQHAQTRMDEFALVPYLTAKRNIAAGSIAPCWIVEKLLGASEPLTAQDEHDIRQTATSLYSGGSDTISATISSFILLMLHHPHIQKKAQAEIDSVTGGEWVPGVRDRAQFPYVHCVVQELVRFAPAVPLVAHSLHVDDNVAGYDIPSGAWVMANIWTYTHDATRYPSPEVFAPERFMGGAPQEDPLGFVFGFGRRSCPGALLARASVFLNVVHLLFAFDIVPAKDDAGMEVLPPLEWTDTFVAHPVPFVCDIRERSAGRIRLLEHALDSLQ